MHRYLPPLETYSQAANHLHNEVIGLILNLIVDRVGKIGTENEITTNFYRSRDSVLYRLSSIGQHLHHLCNTHVHNEARFKSDPQNADLNKAHLALSFASDDVLFNLLSLYDYWANLIALAFLGPNKKRIGWRGLATASHDKANKFSESAIAPSIANHHRSLALKLQDIRAEIIHYEHSVGKTRYEIHVTDQMPPSFSLKSSLPTSISKKLQLTSVGHEDLGVDLQLGLIEIATRSVAWMASAAQTARQEMTGNRVTKREA